MRATLTSAESGKAASNFGSLANFPCAIAPGFLQRGKDAQLVIHHYVVVRGVASLDVRSASSLWT